MEDLRTLVKDLEDKNLKYKPFINLLLEDISKDFKNASRDDVPRVLCGFYHRKKKQIECKLNEISKSRDNMISESGVLDNNLYLYHKMDNRRYRSSLL